MTPPAELADRVRGTGIGAWPGFVTGSALDALRNETRCLATGPHALHFPTSTRVWDLHLHNESFVDLLDHPSLTGLLDDLLGADHLLSDHSLNVVHAGGRPDRWHIDYPFNEMRRLTSGPVLGVQCILALDDFTAANGATCYVPGSHDPPRRPDSSIATDGHPALATAGTLIVLAAATWHRSGVNRTDRPRRAILLSFVERWIRPMTGPPGPGPWGRSAHLRRLLGMERPPESIDGHPVHGPLERAP